MPRLGSVLTLFPVCAALVAAQVPDAPAQPQDLPRSTAQQQGAKQPDGSERSWFGLLVDAKCTSFAKPERGGSMHHGRMPASMPHDHMIRMKPGEEAVLNREAPDTAGRTWNSTDRNTSGTADRQAQQEPVDPARTPDATTGMDRKDRKDHHANPPTTGTMDRRDNRSPATTGSGRGLDTQAANNPYDRRSTAAGESAEWDRSCYISPNSTSFVLHTQDGSVIPLDMSSNTRIASNLEESGRLDDKIKIFRVRVKGYMSGDKLHVSDIEM